MDTFFESAWVDHALGYLCLRQRGSVGSWLYELYLEPSGQVLAAIVDNDSTAKRVGRGVYHGLYVRDSANQRTIDRRGAEQRN